MIIFPRCCFPSVYFYYSCYFLIKLTLNLNSQNGIETIAIEKKSDVILVTIWNCFRRKPNKK